MICAYGFIHDFCRKYGQYMFAAKPTEVKPLTGTQMRNVCTDARKSAGRLYNFTPEDFGYLSNETYNWIATLLNTIEDWAA